MSSTGSNIGLVYDWDVGANFKSDMDANLLLIDRVLQLSIKDRDLTAPPGSPAAGDRYIPATGSTGAWSGHDGKVAVYNGSGWSIYTPKNGWLAVIEDEVKLSTYLSGAWSSGIAL